MSDQKPFTKRQRRSMTQNGIGWRPKNAWGGGDLPAPWAEGDVVRLVGERHERLDDMVGPLFVVVYATSIDEGDGWYFRVSDEPGAHGRCSGRLHVAFADRADHGWDGDVDWMSCFELVDTADPEGLSERERLLAEGWTFTADSLCPSCGRRIPRPATGVTS